MGNGVLKFKSSFFKSKFKKLQTDTQNEDLDEQLEQKQNAYMKVRSKKFSVVAEDSSLSPVNRRRTMLNKASSSEDSSLSSIAESLEEKIDTLTRLKSMHSKNNIKSIKESSSELDEKDKMSENLDHDDDEENKLNEFDSYIDLEMRHSKQHIFEYKDHFSKTEHDDKTNQDELHNFYRYMKPNTNLFKKKIFISSEQPEYEKEEPNDEKKYKIEIIDYTKTTYKVGDNEDSIQSAGKKSPAKYIRSANSEEKEDLIELGINVICRKGSIQDYPNQDDYFIFIDQYTRIFSVFDGHGPFGHVISRLTYKIIMKSLIEHPNFFNDPNLALKNIFINLKEKIKKYLKINLTKQTIKPPNMKFSGATTSIVMQRDRFLYIAHLGDSRVIIGKKQKSKKFPYQLTTDHVPTLPSEKKRIYTNGGEVRKLNNDYIEKIFVRGRIYPGLAVSRSIGDEVASYIGVIGEPEINVYEINLNIDQFILVGTKSVFNYLEEYEIMSILSSFTGKSVKMASDYLYKRVKSAWIQNENGYDDITLIVSYF